MTPNSKSHLEFTAVYGLNPLRSYVNQANYENLEAGDARYQSYEYANFSPLKQRLVKLLKKTRDRQSEITRQFQVVEKDRGKAWKFFKQNKELKKALSDMLLKEIDDFFSTPELTTKAGKIEVTFYCMALKDRQSFENSFNEHPPGENLLGRVASYAKSLKGAAIAHTKTLSGASLGDIEKELKKMSKGPEKEAYLAQLAQLKAHVTQAKVEQQITCTDIRSLGLGPEQELLLRKLLALQPVVSRRELANISEIKTAYDLMSNSEFIPALSVAGLGDAIDRAYASLAGIADSDVQTMSPEAQKIVEKAKRVTTSGQQRQAKTKALKAAFTANSVEAIRDIFVDEYTAMNPTRKLSSAEVKALTAQAEEMAKNVMRLKARADRGQPALSEAETQAYFKVIHQIAKALPEGLQLQDVSFKVKHSLKGQQTIKIRHANPQAQGKLPEIKIDLGAHTLPYSLWKPPGGDFIFSYGGTRGAVAPSEAMNASYPDGTQKQRWFTNSFLLGVGQYASVKEVEFLLSGLNAALKKGYVPKGPKGTFTEAARQTAGTRAATSRDDPFSRIESDVLKALASAENKSGRILYWTGADKARKAGILYEEDGSPEQYWTLIERAKGDTFADTANQALKLANVSSEAYHNPLMRTGVDHLSDLKESLALSRLSP